MKICDRCENKTIGMILIDQMNHTEIDLCKTCAEEFEEWKKSPEPEERKRGRPRKDGGA